MLGVFVCFFVCLKLEKQKNTNSTSLFNFKEEKHLKDGDGDRIVFVKNYMFEHRMCEFIYSNIYITKNTRK